MNSVISIVKLEFIPLKVKVKAYLRYNEEFKRRKRRIVQFTLCDIQHLRVIRNNHPLHGREIFRKIHPCLLKWYM